MPKLILLTGVRGSGKDFFADEMVKLNGYIKIGFSDSVREYSWKALGWSPETPEEYDEFKKTHIRFTIFNKTHFLSGRSFLTNIGDKVMKFYDPDVWANCWKRKAIIEYKKDCDINIVAFDLRHKNEYLSAKNFAEIMGYELQVYFCDFHSSRYEISDHSSESLAVRLLKAGFTHRENITDKIEQYL